MRRKEKPTFAKITKDVASCQIRPLYFSGEVDHSGAFGHEGGHTKPTFAKRTSAAPFRRIDLCYWPADFAVQAGKNKQAFGKGGTRWRGDSFSLGIFSAGFTIRAETTNVRKKKRTGRHFVGSTPIVAPAELAALAAKIRGLGKRQAQWQFGRYTLVSYFRRSWPSSGEKTDIRKKNVGWGGLADVRWLFPRRIWPFSRDNKTMFAKKTAAELIWQICLRFFPAKETVQAGKNGY